LEQFLGQQYLSLETYRKTGAAVATPVWFAQDNELFYVYSLVDAGKVKRIRNNPRVRIAPCSARGMVKGPWVDAEARIVEGREEEHGHKLLNQKYWLKSLGDLFSKLMNRKRAVIVIRLR
jgi:PPOX class probable F420-dependent enzyme